MKNKSKPQGVRFDLEKVSFLMKREGLETYQQVVNFALNKYWWEFKVPNPTHKECPPLHLKEQINEEVATDKKTEFRVRRSYDNYVSLMRGLELEQEYIDLANEIKSADNLTEKQRETLLLALSASKMQ